jgi:hypothetical protein
LKNAMMSESRNVTDGGGVDVEFFLSGIPDSSARYI